MRTAIERAHSGELTPATIPAGVSSDHNGTSGGLENEDLEAGQDLMPDDSDSETDDDDCIMVSL